MARLTVKASVRFKGFTPALLRILRAVYACAERCDDVAEVVITSANDSTHGPNSRHYADEALDLRVHNFPNQMAVQRFAQALRDELGPGFTVLYESPGTPNAHLHLQPKKGTGYGYAQLVADERRYAPPVERRA